MGVTLIFMVTANKTVYSSVNEIGMLIIPEGCFMMGSKDGYADEKPRHEVCIDSFSMAVFGNANGCAHRR